MNIILTALYSACFSAFIDFCFNEGMIFEWYYKRLLKIDHLLISKPLGLCIYCMSSWVFIGLFSFEVLEKCDLRQFAFELFCGLGINFIFVKIYTKYLS